MDRVRPQRAAAAVGPQSPRRWIVVGGVGVGVGCGCRCSSSSSVSELERSA